MITITTRVYMQYKFNTQLRIEEEPLITVKLFIHLFIHSLHTNATDT